VGSEERAADPAIAATLDEHLHSLAHSWARVCVLLCITLVPLFLLLDWFMAPRELLPRFVAYRAISTGLMVVQYFVIRFTAPSRVSLFHGYLVTVIVGGAIALMTHDLGGFNSPYYAGLNLVMLGVNLLMPWTARQAAANSGLVLMLYVGFNLVMPAPEPARFALVLNNVYFLASTAVITISISHLKWVLVSREYHARSNLKAAHDALWGEMEVAKRIQTALLPKVHNLEGYSVASLMVPADEVGGDYYDIIQTATGETWLSIGDVSGHGVESGLFMMMTQTSIFTTVSYVPQRSPSRVLECVNGIISENISRLGADLYMTISALVLQDDKIVFAGKHQDILIYRSASRAVDAVSTTGTWIGVIRDLTGKLTDTTIPIEPGDVLLLYTDGVTEATDAHGALFGESRLSESLARYGHLEVSDLVERIVVDVRAFMAEQLDDMSIVAVKRTPALPARELCSTSNRPQTQQVS
jgi:serine phosphatase RsbU (regulator of sigma subunit)